MHDERMPLGSAEWVTASTRMHGLWRGEQTTVLAAPAWFLLTPDQQERVDAAAVLKLAALYGLRGRKYYDGILDFAREYGALGRLTEHRVIAPVWQSVADADDNDDPPSAKRAARTAKVKHVGRIRHVMGEPIETWNETISDAWWICGYLHLLGIIEQEDASDELEHYLLMTPLLREHVLNRPDVQDPPRIGPRGRAWLIEWLTDCAEKGVTPLPHQVARRLKQAAKKDDVEWVMPDLSLAEKRTVFVTELRLKLNVWLRNGEIRPVVVGDLPMRLEWQPETLRGALWLQVARLTEQSGTVRFRKCAECRRTPLVFTGDRSTGTRAGSEYCSQACTQRAYRKRQARARTLHQQGWTIADIARELRMDTHKGRKAHDIIGGWLKPKGTGTRGLQRGKAKRQRRGEH